MNWIRKNSIQFSPQAGIIVGDVILEVNNDPLLGANYEKVKKITHNNNHFIIIINNNEIEVSQINSERINR